MIPLSWSRRCTLDQHENDEFFANLGSADLAELWCCSSLGPNQPRHSYRQCSGPDLGYMDDERGRKMDADCCECAGLFEYLLSSSVGPYKAQPKALERQPDHSRSS